MLVPITTQTFSGANSPLPKTLPAPASKEMGTRQRDFMQRSQIFTLWLRLLMTHHKKITRALQLGFDLPPAPRSISQTSDAEAQARWEIHFMDLLEFRTQTGHSNVPFYYKKNEHLAGWVQLQRDLAKKGELSQSHKERLQQVNFHWTVKNEQLDLWEYRFKSLAEFNQINGYCNVQYETRINHWDDGYRLNVQFINTRNCRVIEFVGWRN